MPDRSRAETFGALPGPLPSRPATAPFAGWPVHRWGAGPRRVLFCHASLAQGAAWGPIAHHLGPGVTALAPDLPGHGIAPGWVPDADGTGLGVPGRRVRDAARPGPDGASAPGPDAPPIAAVQGDYHRLATDLMAAVAGPRPVDLVGHSLGGVILLRLALERPEIVRRLVLIEPVLFAAVTGGRAPPEHAGLSAALQAGDLPRAARLFMDLWGEGAGWAALSDRQRQGVIRRMPHIAACSAVLNQDGAGLLAPGRLEALQRPVLLIRGGRSPDLARRIIAALALRLPQARIAILPDAGHMAPMTHGERVAGLIADFLAG